MTSRDHVRQEASQAIKSQNDDVDGISEAQLKRFLALVDAVRARDVAGSQAATNDGASGLERLKSTFGYEVISALMGRTGPEGNPFANSLAVIERKTGQKLKIQHPKGLKRATAEVRPRVGQPEKAVVSARDLVTLKTIKDSQEIAGVIIYASDGRPVAVAGLIAAIPAAQG